MIAYDFSKIMKREGRVYGLDDISFGSNGLPTMLVKIFVVLLGIELCFVIPYCVITDNWFINPFIDNLDFTGFFVVLAIPLSIACGLYYIRIQQYRLYQFLYIYLKPKNPINIKGKVTPRVAIKIDAFLER